MAQTEGRILAPETSTQEKTRVRVKSSFARVNDGLASRAANRGRLAVANGMYCPQVR
jgi:hypothetical protein